MPEVVGTTRLRVAECLQGDYDSDARTSGWLDVSTVGAAPFAQIAQCLISKRIKATRCDIFLDLPIPGGGVQLGEPGPECREVLRGEPPNCILDFFNGAHDDKLTLPGTSAQPRQARELVKPRACRGDPRARPGRLLRSADLKVSATGQRNVGVQCWAATSSAPCEDVATGLARAAGARPREWSLRASWRRRVRLLLPPPAPCHLHPAPGRGLSQRHAA